MKNKIYQVLLLLAALVLLTSCNTAPSTTTNDIQFTTTEIIATTLTPAKTNTATQMANTSEVVMLLRPRDVNKIDIVGVNASCFNSIDICKPNTIIQLPKSLPQVLKIYWLTDGINALFWDSDSGIIYKLDRFSGHLQIYKEGIWKTRSDFSLSPDGKTILFEVNVDAFENEIVSLDVNSDEMSTLKFPVQGIKRVSMWLSNDEFLFWTEIFTGQKGYLENIQVYKFDRATQALQTVDLGLDWMNTTAPFYSPDGKNFIVSQLDSIIFFNKEGGEKKKINMSAESYIWSPDSTWLTVYTQAKEFYILDKDGNEIKKFFTAPQGMNLSDWLWIPGTEVLLMVMSDTDGNTTLVKYSLQNDALSTIKWPLLDNENIVSLSYRPAAK